MLNQSKHNVSLVHSLAWRPFSEEPIIHDPLLFDVNWSSYSWDTAVSKFYLENPRSRSWPRSTPPWEKNWPPWLLTVTKMVTASRDWAVTCAVIELWPSRDWAVIMLKMPWLSCDLTVTELWPRRDWAVTSPSRDHWAPEPWPPWSPWAHGDHNAFIAFDAYNSIDMFAFHFMAFRPFWFEIWQIPYLILERSWLRWLEYKQYVCFSFHGNRTIFG